MKPASLMSFPRPSCHSREGGNPEACLLLDKETEPIASISYPPPSFVVSCLVQPIREGTVSVEPHSQPGGDSPSSPACAIQP